MHHLVNIITFSLACSRSAGSTVAHSWITPEDVQIRFKNDIGIVRAGMKFGSDWCRLSVSPNEAGNIAAGPIWSDLVPTAISLKDFTEAFNIVASGSGDCFETLVYFSFRPPWYTPLRDEVIRARDCIHILINRIPISVDTSDDEAVYMGSLMADAVSRLLRVLYTEDADEVVSQAVATPPSFNESLSFTSFINQSDVFKALLPIAPEAPNVDDIIDHLYPIDAYYLRQMREAGYNHSRMVHFPDFFDSVFVHMIGQAVDTSIEAALFRLATSQPINFGYHERMNHMRKHYMLENPGTLFHRRSVGFQNSVSRQRNAFRQIAAGSVQSLINNHSRQHARACMPMHEEEFRAMESKFPWQGDERDESTLTIYMYDLMNKPDDLLRFYECILSAISSGIINPPSTNSAVSGLGFLTRMVTSMDALFLRHM